MTTSKFNMPSPFEARVAGTTKRAFSNVEPVSFVRLNICGILTTVYGLEEAPADRKDVACIFLLHGRLEWQDPNSHVAAALLRSWNARKLSQRGLICVAFDQRNHGSRLVDKTANLSWLDGNENHAVDMWTLYNGTAQDVSMILTHLPTYIGFTPTVNICSGVSLGGHASWHCILADPRINAAMIVVGCPDYVRLMKDRAIKNKRTDPQGATFLGSKDFPHSLLQEADRYDPAAVLCGRSDTAYSQPSEVDIARARSLLESKLQGKSILVMTGGKDKLVPYKHTEPFLTWLKTAIDPQTGWANDLGISVVDYVDPDAGHEFSPGMRTTTENWLGDYLSRKRTPSSMI